MLYQIAAAIVDKTPGGATIARSLPLFYLDSDASLATGGMTPEMRDVSMAAHALDVVARMTRAYEVSVHAMPADRSTLGASDWHRYEENVGDERAASAVDCILTVQAHLWAEASEEDDRDLFAPDKQWTADTIANVADALQACGFAPGDEWGPETWLDKE